MSKIRKNIKKLFKHSNNNNVVFTIIIPLYNKAKYIKKTLNNVLQQKNIYELIVINDCSTDNSLKICRRFKKKFKSIKIINSKKKLYVSESRNVGIKKAKGEYLIFLDADDSLKKNYLTNLFKIVSVEKYDLVIGNLGDLNKISGINSRKDFLREINLNKFTGHSGSGIIGRNVYRKDFLEKNNLKFDKKILVGEDEEFTANCYLKSRKIYILQKNYYNKHMNPFGLSHVNLGQKLYGYDIEKFLKSYLLVIISMSKSLYKVKNLQLVDYFKNRISLMLNKLYPLIILSNNSLLRKISNSFILSSVYLNKVSPKIKNLLILDHKNKINLRHAKSKLVSKFNFFLNKYKNFRFYLFCCDHPTFAMIKLMQNQNIKIIGILDNNYNNYNKKFEIFNIPLKNLKKEIYQIKNNKDVLVNILNQKKENILNISQQLKDLGIGRKRIKSILFCF